MAVVRIMGLSGSPRREKNTELLLNAALKAAMEVQDTRVELVRVGDYRLMPCDGCNTCVRDGTCPLDEKDDAARLRQKLVECDALIVAAPSYFGSVPGVLKNLMDRSRTLKMKGHLLGGKIIAGMSVSGLREGGGEDVINEVCRFGLIHGMIVVGACGDPASQSWAPVGTLQGDKGWKRIAEDEVALKAAANLGGRVAEVASALSRGRV